MARQPSKAKTPAPEPVIAPEPVGPAEAEAGGILTIDLGAIAANYRALSSRVMPSECAAVVKADAYGCGIEPVTRTLVREGCRTFFVAHLSEARQVRTIAPEAVIYVLNGYATGSEAGFVEAFARPVINSALELAEWDHVVRSGGWSAGFALHVDTGMNRLGLGIEEAAGMAGRAAVENHGITLLMSHFACAEVPEHPLNDRQIRSFRELRTLYRGVPASLANSAGIFLDSSAHCDVVRPGMALYGLNPTPGFPNPMRRAVEIKARIIQVRQVPIGTTVGYQAAWHARRDSRIGIVAAGYADGVLRASQQTDSGTGRHVEAAGKRCRILGRISMDLMAIDLTDLPDNAVRRGDFVTLVGGDLDLDAVAAEAGTIGYELLTNLGRRFRRVYTI